MMNSQNARLLGQKIFERSDISPSQLDISSRQINYWIFKIILPFVETPVKEKNKRLSRVRLNLANAIWASIIKELFDVGVSSKRLAKLAKDVWHKPRIEEYADDVIKDAINGKYGPIDKVDIESLKRTLNDEILMSTLRMEINPFTDMIKSWFMNRKFPHSLVYIPKSGEHIFLMNDGKFNITLASLAQKSSIVTVPLLPIFLKVVSQDFYGPNPSLEYLNNIEQQIRDIVVFKAPKAVHIALEENQIKTIEVTESHKSREQLAKYILENKIAKGSKLLIDIRSQGNYKLTLIK